MLTKTKLCWNCNASVDRASENCIYCGVYLHPTEEEMDAIEEEESAPLSNHEPLYQPKGDLPEETTPLFKQSEEKKIESTPDTNRSSGSIQNILFPLLFLFAGSVFILFSLILFLFAKDGILTLRWDASYWFIYLLIALPLLYLGWQTLKNADR